MIDIHTGLELKNIPILEDEQVYIYAMLNTCNKIKIGITKNIQQRYQSLCGSNSQGNEIIKVYVSESTYLNNLEKMIHEHFGQFRLKKTEWFASNKFGTLKYEEVIEYIEQLFSSADYKRCNEVRKRINELNKRKKNEK